MRKLGGFTLIELLVVIGILAILATVAVLVINPAELFRGARDSKRLSELTTLNKALQIVEITIPNASFGTANVVYVSLPDTSPTCATYSLPSLPSGWSYNCANSANFRKTNGTGWVPVNFDAVPITSLSVLPVDPVNNVGNYYTYVTGGSWALAGLMESERYLKESAVPDGGTDFTRFEVGSDLKLWAQASGLVGYWKFDGNLNDSSGNGHNGSIGGGNPPYQNCKIGQCPAFNGWSDYIVINEAWTFGSDYTITSWIKTTSAGQKPIVSNRSGGGDVYYGVVNSKAFLYENDCVPPSITSNINVNDNNFHFYAFVRIGSPMAGKVYLDGILNNSNTPTGCGSDTGSQLRIAHDVANATEYFPGSIDEVRIYNRALTENEISAMYNATK